MPELKRPKLQLTTKQALVAVRRIREERIALTAARNTLRKLDGNRHLARDERAQLTGEEVVQILNALTGAGNLLAELDAVIQTHTKQTITA